LKIVTIIPTLINQLCRATSFTAIQLDGSLGDDSDARLFVIPFVTTRENALYQEKGMAEVLM